jgi:hypothetical protein
LARIAPMRPRVVVGDGAVRYADQVARWIGTAPVPVESLPPPPARRCSSRFWNALAQAA